MLQNWSSIILSFSLGLLNPSHTYGEIGLSTALRDFRHQGITHLTRHVVSQVQAAGFIPKMFGGGLSYYLGVIASEENNSESCLLFWEHSLLNDANPWRDQSYLAGVTFLRNRKSWDKLKEWTELRLNTVPQDEHAAWYRVWAMFELGLFEDAKKELPANIPQQGLGADQLVFQTLSRVLSLDPGQASSVQRLVRHIWDNEANDIHVKIHFYLSRMGQLNVLDAPTLSLLKARAELASGRNLQAYNEIRRVIDQSALYRTPGVWNDLVRIYARSGKSSEGNMTLTPRAASLNGYLGVIAWSALGRLRSTAGLHSSARDAFLNAIQHAGDSENLDSLYQQAASSAFQLGFRQGMDILNRAPWRRPDVYSATLQRQIAEILKRRDFPQLLDIYSRLGGKLSATDRLNLEWILVRLSHHGLMRWNTRSMGMSSQQMLERIARTVGTSYPILMARYILDLPLFEIPEESVWPNSNQRSDAFLQGFLDLGLSFHAYRQFNTSGTDIDWNFASKLLSNLVKEEQYLPSIRLVTRLSSRNGFRIGLSEWKILYPLAYWQQIQEVSARERLDPLLFLSLVREESLFDSKIHSPVGATGLSQLMPATFREQSRRMGLIDPDIYDPFTNLSIGGNYLAMRLRTLGHPSKALMAYNAGAHRVTSWNPFLNQLPDELMTESIPFFETRNYVKKILRSRIIYSILYQMGSIDEAVRSVYPNFSK